MKRYLLPSFLLAVLVTRIVLHFSRARPDGSRELDGWIALGIGSGALLSGIAMPLVRRLINWSVLSVSLFGFLVGVGAYFLLLGVSLNGWYGGFTVGDVDWVRSVLAPSAIGLSVGFWAWVIAYRRGSVEDDPLDGNLIKRRRENDWP